MPAAARDEGLWIHYLEPTRSEQVGSRLDGSEFEVLTRMAFRSGTVTVTYDGGAAITWSQLGPNRFDVRLPSGDPIPAGSNVLIAGDAPGAGSTPPPVERAPVRAIDITVTSVGQPVSLGAGGILTRSDPSDPGKMPCVGIVEEILTPSTARIESRNGFEVSDPSWTWTEGGSVFVGPGGVLIQDGAVAAALPVTQNVAVAASSMRLSIFLREPTE